VLAVTHLHSSTFAALLTAAVLVTLSVPIVRYVADREHAPWLTRFLVAGLVLHLLASPAQIFVVDHFYHGVADWIRYDTQGSILAPGFRHLDFSLAQADVRGIVNDGSVSIAAGIVMAVVGVNQLAAFLVFSWLSWLGTTFFFRAFTITFPGAPAGHRRFAWMLFLLPSMIFWTADVSKESIMMLSLGVTAFGAAKVLDRRRGGYLLMLVGVAIGILIRPNELLIILGGFVLALMVRPSDRSQQLGGLRRIGGLALMGSVLGVSVYLTLRYLHTSGGSLSLNQASAGNQGVGEGFGSSGVAYSSNPLYYWRDVYEILWDPLPFNASGAGELLASFENTVILVLVLASLRNLAVTVRAGFARPYVLMCSFYSVAFLYAFAALGNLGLITRERVLLFPFLLTLLCIPRTPKGRPTEYPWELRRRDRRRFLAALVARSAVRPTVGAGTPAGAPGPPARG
jgi:hypothetical protein